MHTGTRKTTFIADLTEGQTVQDLFMVSKKNLAETKAGKPYLALTLLDRSGDIEARIWDDATRLDSVAEVGRVVMVEGQAKPFREQLQLNITNLQPTADDQVRLEEFMPASKRPVAVMLAELDRLIDDIADSDLRQLLTAIFAGDFREEFSKAPAAKMMHHAYLGGLLEHTLSVAGLGHLVASYYPQLDRDMLLAGALLHDIGKVKEFSFSSPPFDYTDSGRLVGHLMLGTEMVRQAAGQVKGFPAGKLDRLIHMILSHHGRHEFGSPCLPMTLEAMLLHHLDDMDAKVNYIDRLSEQVGAGEFQWSDYQRPLERFLLLRGPEGTAGLTPGPVPAGPEPTGRKKSGNKEAPEPPSRQQPLF